MFRTLLLEIVSLVTVLFVVCPLCLVLIMSDKCLANLVNKIMKFNSNYNKRKKIFIAGHSNCFYSLLSILLWIDGYTDRRHIERAMAMLLKVNM